MTDECPDRIDYIKQSLDKLHEKVDTVYVDADTRLKVLEIEKAHDKGFIRAMGSISSVVGGLVGGVFTAVSSYYIFRK